MRDKRLHSFTERYRQGNIPWDSGITPPEIFEVLEQLPAGRALDLGCGTGTVIRDLLQAGWRADGVDFVGRAIDLAKAKLKDFPAESFRLFCHDVTMLDNCSGLRPPYDLIIDIGCGHCIDKSAAAAYSRAIASMLETKGTFMLYAGHPRPDSTIGWTPQEVEALFTPLLELVWQRQGSDAAIGAPSGWYRLSKG